MIQQYSVNHVTTLKLQNTHKIIFQLKTQRPLFTMEIENWFVFWLKWGYIMQLNYT